MDDAKTLSQVDAIQECNLLLNEIGHSNLGGNAVNPSNETNMTENEAFLAYCKQGDDDDDD